VRVNSITGEITGEIPADIPAAGPGTAPGAVPPAADTHLPAARRARPHPRVRMHLPDGQHLEVDLVSWHQYRDGSWRARVRWPVWGAVLHGRDVRTSPRAAEAYVPVHALTPVGGEDYRAVRRHRPRIGTPRRG
jgi:hypothetical protein